MKAFLRLGTIKDVPSSLLLFNIVLEVLAQAVRQKKKKKERKKERKKRHVDWKERSKTISVCREQDHVLELINNSVSLQNTILIHKNCVSKK